MSVRRAPALEPTRAAGPDRFVPYAERTTATMLAMPPVADTDMYGVDKEAQRKGRIEDRGAAAKAARAAELARRRARESSSDDDSDEEMEEKAPVFGNDYSDLNEDVIEDMFNAAEVPPHFLRERKDTKGGEYRRVKMATSDTTWQQHDNFTIMDRMKDLDFDVDWIYLTKTPSKKSFEFTWEYFADVVAFTLDVQNTPGSSDADLYKAVQLTKNAYNQVSRMLNEDGVASNKGQTPVFTQRLAIRMSEISIQIIKLMRAKGSRLEKLMEKFTFEAGTGMLI